MQQNKTKKKKQRKIERDTEANRQNNFKIDSTNYE